MPAANVSEEISHLMRDKGWTQKHAVGAALNMKRQGYFKKGGRMRKKKRGKRRY